MFGNYLTSDISNAGDDERVALLLGLETDARVKQ